ncbi:MAG: VOC family protein [Acidobacteria bacterium]|nr:VOC family protein [Acidobacteriota bacterium]
MYKKLTANIIVSNVNGILDFYEKILGFSLVMAVPEGSQQVVTVRDKTTLLGFAIIRRDDVELMLQSRKSLANELPSFAGSPVGTSFTLYIQTDDIEALYKGIKDKSAIIEDLHTTFYGAREFCIRDSGSNVLTFAGSQ